MFKKITFKNGLRLILVLQPSSLATTVLVLTEAGLAYETKDINGLSHFLEHMTFKGTTKRPKPDMISAEFESLGAEYNAFTGEEYTGYWAKAEAQKLPKILDLIADLYLNPIFNEVEIEKEKGVIIEEINMYKDMPTHQVHELFQNLLYGDQPMGWSVAGRKEIIRKLKRENFIEYKNKHYIGPSTIITIAGNFEEKETIALVKKYFDKLEKKPKVKKFPTKESQKNPALKIKFKKCDQTHLVLGFRAFPASDKRVYTLQLITEILGGGMASRLFRKIRTELGAAYYVRAASSLFLDHGYFAVFAGVNHKKTEIVIKTILEEIKRLKYELVTDEELQRAKDHMIGKLVLGLETSSDLADFYGSQEILNLKIKTPDQIIKKIRSISASQIQKVSQDIFKNSGLNLSIVGPWRKSVTFSKILAL